MLFNGRLVHCTLREKKKGGGRREGKSEGERLPEKRTLLIFLWPSPSTLLMRIGVNSSDIRFNGSESVGTKPLEKRARGTPVWDPVTFT